MATATKQLEAIFQEIQKQFSGNSAITVKPLDGDPPEKYEVTYAVAGFCKTESGEIQQQDSHTITISIPFGFPHFPPSCKPKSAIFHPDFDPAAICIGDYWEKDRSISDLIIHIGQMISGTVYSTTNAFNEEAAQWYQENQSRLPLDQLPAVETAETPADDSSDEITLEPVVDDEITLELDEETLQFDDELVEEVSLETEPSIPPADSGEEIADEVAEVDTLDESFLDSDFEYPEGDEEEEQVTESDEPVVDNDRFQLMARQKRYFELDMELGELSDGNQFPEQENLAAQAAEALKQARDVYNQGTDFEHQGNPSRALAAFEQVEEICSDYPGLQEDIERTKQAKELLGDWAEPEPQQASDIPEEGDDTSLDDELELSGDDDFADLKSDSRTFFEETARKTSKVVPFAITIALLICAAVVGVYYYFSTSTLEDAQSKFAECQAVLKQNRFSEAERQCQIAIDIANQVQYFHSGSRNKLIEEINVVLNSPGLTEGLAGNLLLDGKYLPKKVVKTIKAFRYFEAEGDKHFQQEAWQQAAASYNQALNLTQSNEGVDPQTIYGVTERLKTAEFNVLLRSGTELIERQKWVLATEELNKALDSVKSLNIENKAEIIDQITEKLAEISLATSKEQGDSAFAEGRWSEALTHYKKALNVIKRSYAPDNPTIIELNQLVIKAELYHRVNEGKEAFNSADWDYAIESYGKAIEILESNREILKQTSTEENRQKLARVMLQASVMSSKQDAARYLKDKDYEMAIEELQSIVNSIGASPFVDEEEFAAVIDETRQLIEQTESDILLADKIIYLQDNFKELFTAHYTLSSPDSLIQPRVEFDKQIGQKLIFKLQCTEIGRGRPLKLIMKYAHNLADGTWSFYSSNQ